MIIMIMTMIIITKIMIIKIMIAEVELRSLFRAQQDPQSLTLL